MADEPQQQALPGATPEPAAKPKRLTWPKDFDPRKGQPKGAAFSLTAEEWTAIHGEVPLSIYALRGRFVLVDPEIVSDAGSMGETIRVDVGCRNCGARVLVVTPVGVICIGCGATI